MDAKKKLCVLMGFSNLKPRACCHHLDDLVPTWDVFEIIGNSRAECLKDNPVLCRLV